MDEFKIKLPATLVTSVLKVHQWLREHAASTPDAWTVYILRCADDSLYTGITRDIARRLHEHNHCNRTGARYTRGRRPVQLVFHCDVASRSAAAAGETAIKKLGKAAKEILIRSAADRQISGLRTLSRFFAKVEEHGCR